MPRDLRPAAVGIFAITILFGVLYPLATTGLAQALFPAKAGGSVVERGGEPVGSSLIGQDFGRDTGRRDGEGEPVLEADVRYFQSRPSATRYAADGSYFNNLGPNQRELADVLERNLAAYLDRERAYDGTLERADVPADAVTTSASGVDPHISLANARIQAIRVAGERGLTPARVLELVEAHTSRSLLGLGGEPSVNVLEVNLELDRRAGGEARRTTRIDPRLSPEAR